MTNFIQNTDVFIRKPKTSTISTAKHNSAQIMRYLTLLPAKSFSPNALVRLPWSSSPVSQLPLSLYPIMHAGCGTSRCASWDNQNKARKGGLFCQNKHYLLPKQILPVCVRQITAHTTSARPARIADLTSPRLGYLEITLLRHGVHPLGDSGRCCCCQKVWRGAFPKGLICIS